MHYYILSTTFLLVFIILFFYSTSFIWRDKKRIGFSLITLILFKIPLFIKPFFGLEYEDSYIFNVVARQFENGIYSNSYFTETIVNGSYLEPISMGLYNGHYIMFSVFSSWVFRIFEYSPFIISYINVIISFLTIIVLSEFSSILKLNKEHWWIIPSIYLLSPVINVFNSSQLSETFSGFLIVCFIYSSILFKNKASLLKGLFVLVSFSMAILTKRENSILILFPISMFIFDAFEAGRVKFSNKDFLSASLVLLVLFHQIFIENGFSSVISESSGIRQSAFSIKYLLHIFPVFIKSLLSLKYFSVFGILFLVSLFLIPVYKPNAKIKSIVTIVLGFLFLYSIHFRSYYFVHYNSINIFETFRYLTNLAPIISIIIGFSLIYLYSKSKTWKYSISTLLVLGLIGSFIMTISNRTNFTKEEYSNRMEGSISAINKLYHENKDYCLVSSHPMIFQIFGNLKMKNVDLIHINPEILKKECSSVFLYKTKEFETPEFKERYPLVDIWLKTCKEDSVINIDEGSELVRLVL